MLQAMLTTSNGTPVRLGCPNNWCNSKRALSNFSLCKWFGCQGEYRLWRDPTSAESTTNLSDVPGKPLLTAIDRSGSSHYRINAITISLPHRTKFWLTCIMRCVSNWVKSAWKRRTCNIPYFKRDVAPPHFAVVKWNGRNHFIAELAWSNDIYKWSLSWSLILFNSQSGYDEELNTPAARRLIALHFLRRIFYKNKSVAMVRWKLFV